METNRETKLLRHRFIEDTDAPIQVLISPYFEQRINLFERDFHTETDYKDYVKQLDYFDGNINKFLEDYHTLRDDIINSVLNSEAYKEYNADEKLTKEIRNFKPKVGNVNLYIVDNALEGKNHYLSLDMKKANFQALRHYNPAILMDAETYPDFIGKFTDMPWAKKSKRTRQIIFGKLNPKRTMELEKLIIADIEQWVSKNTNINEFYDLYSMNSDEIIYKLKSGFTQDDARKKVNVTEELIKNNTGFDIRVEFFDLSVHEFKTQESETLHRVFTKDKDDCRDYKCADIIYFPQTYKLINGLEVTKDDLVFYYAKAETATFFNPLIKVENER